MSFNKSTKKQKMGQRIVQGGRRCTMFVQCELEGIEIVERTTEQNRIIKKNVILF